MSRQLCWLRLHHKSVVVWANTYNRSCVLSHYLAGVNHHYTMGRFAHVVRGGGAGSLIWDLYQNPATDGSNSVNLGAMTLDGAATRAANASTYAERGITMRGDFTDPVGYLAGQAYFGLIFDTLSDADIRGSKSALEIPGPDYVEQDYGSYSHHGYVYWNSQHGNLYGGANPYYLGRTAIAISKQAIADYQALAPTWAEQTWTTIGYDYDPQLPAFETYTDVGGEVDAVRLRCLNTIGSGTTLPLPVSCHLYLLGFDPRRGSWEPITEWFTPLGWQGDNQIADPFTSTTEHDFIAGMAGSRQSPWTGARKYTLYTVGMQARGADATEVSNFDIQVRALIDWAYANPAV